MVWIQCLPFSIIAVWQVQLQIIFHWKATEQQMYSSYINSGWTCLSAGMVQNDSGCISILIRPMCVPFLLLFDIPLNVNPDCKYWHFSLNSLSMQYGQQKFQWNLASTMFLWILTFLQWLTITIERLTYNVFLYLKQIFFWPWNNIGQISKIQIKKEYDICKVWHKTLNIFGMDTDKHVAPPYTIWWLIFNK